MLSNRILNGLVMFFARKAKPLPPVNVANNLNVNQQLIVEQNNRNMFSKSQENIVIQQRNELSQEYERQLKQKIKQKVANELKFNPSYQGQDPTPNKLVNRPSKGVVWGLGGQLMLANKKVQLQGLKDDMDQIIEFLELNQVKNIYIHDFHKQNPERPQTNKRRYAILGSCYSARHCWKTGTQLRNAFNLYSGKSKLRKRGKKYDPIFATRTGGKDEEFCMVDYKDYSISLMTEQQRQAMDLQWKWNNQVPQQTLDKYMRAKLNKKGRKNQFQDF